MAEDMPAVIDTMLATFQDAVLAKRGDLATRDNRVLVEKNREHEDRAERLRLANTQLANEKSAAQKENVELKQQLERIRQKAPKV
jgi:hypothetical protein